MKKKDNVITRLRWEFYHTLLVVGVWAIALIELIELALD